MSRLKGVLPPVVSPFSAGEAFDYGCFERNIRRLLAAGADGLYLCGGTGDAGRLRVEERKRAVEAALPIARAMGKNAVVHVGLANQRDAVQLAEHAAKLGADAVAAIPPDGDATQIRAFYTALAQVGLPTLVYHIPAVTHRNPPFEELLDLLRIQGVVGMKMTDWNLFNLRRLRLEVPEAILLSGYDELTAPGLMYGASGAIGTWQNLMPEVYIAIWGSVNAGNYVRALNIQNALTAFLHQCWNVGVMESFEALMVDAGYLEGCFRAPWTSIGRAKAHAALPLLRQSMDEVYRAVNE